jgi:transposase
MAAEIISTVERRRHWPTEEKLRIMSEALEPGVTIASVADRNGVCRSLVYTWLRDVIARIGSHPINRLAELMLAETHCGRSYIRKP